MSAKIKKKWCAVDIIKDSPGIVVKTAAGGVAIIYLEGQCYEPEWWTNECVKRFATPQALAKYLSTYPEFTRENPMDTLRNKFPSEFKEKKARGI